MTKNPLRRCPPGESSCNLGEGLMAFVRRRSITSKALPGRSRVRPSHKWEGEVCVDTDAEGE